VRGLLWPLSARWAWEEPATEVAGTTGEVADLTSVRFFCVVKPAADVGGKAGEGAGLASVPSIGVGSSSHFVGGNDR
jgi:hypothetical protein